MFEAIRSKIPIDPLLDDKVVNSNSPGDINCAKGIYSVATIENPEDFRLLRDEWTSLLETTSNNCLFLTWDWMHTWWRHLRENRTLHIVTVHRGHELVLIAPLTSRPGNPKALHMFRRFEYLGTGYVGSDYLDIIVHPDRDDDALAVLGDYFARQGIIVKLAQMDSASPHIKALALQMAGRNWDHNRTETDVSPFLDLGGQTWESFLAGLGKSHRVNVRKKLRKIYKTFNVTFEQAASEERRKAALETLFSLHHKRWNGNGGSDAFHTPGLVAFHRDFSRIALTRGWLRLYILCLDGAPVAAVYGFLYERVFYFYQAGFNTDYGEYSIGLLAQGLAIRAAMEEGAVTFDFLHGGENYKYLWTSRHRKLERLVLLPPGYRGYLYKQTMVLKNNVKKFIRSSHQR